jgi:integrase
MRGHIRERSPGHWAIVIDARDAQGQRKRRWHSFRGTKREAQIECARLIAEQQDGGAIEPNKITLDQFLARFEADWASVHVSAQTFERYRCALKPVRRALGDRPLQKLQAADLAQLYATMVRAGRAPSTIRLLHAIVHRAMETARAWGLLKDNPADHAKPPKVSHKETGMLQPDQAAALLDRLRGKPLYLIASLLLGTGLRRNEALGLRWGNIDLEAGRLTVEQSLEQTTGRIGTKGPKTKHGKRTISLPVHLVTELRQHWREQQEQRLAAGLGKAPPEAPVFATAGGGYLSPNQVTKAWQVAMMALGLSITLHSLRHTHASMLIASGMDILTISRRLGHSSPTITLGVYGHLIHGTDDQAARIMDAAFGSKMVAGPEKKPMK